VEVPPGRARNRSLPGQPVVAVGVRPVVLARTMVDPGPGPPRHPNARRSGDYRSGAHRSVLYPAAALRCGDGGAAGAGSPRWIPRIPCSRGGRT